MSRTCDATLLVCLLVLPAPLVHAQGQPTAARDALALGACDPTFDPNGNFLSNFARRNSCYTIALTKGSGSSTAGDLNAIYNVAYFKTNPNYELIVVGTFPESRFLGLAAYDEHQVSRASIDDHDIVPLTAQMQNPYQPGAVYKTGQKYAFVVSFGGAQPAAVSAGCGYTGYNLRSNILTVTDIHATPTWTGYSNLPPHFPAHKQGKTTAGSVYIRSYLPAATNSQDALQPYLIVRDLRNGCAVTAEEALNTLQMIDVSTVDLFHPWMDTDQINSHYYVQNDIVGRTCYGKDPYSKVTWGRGGEYAPGDNPAAAYSNAQLTPAIVNALVTDTRGMYLRIRFRAPLTPVYPCTGCKFDDSGELRYWSLSFQSQGTTFASVSDDKVVKDSEGYVTLVVKIGPYSPVPAPPPPQVTAQNGYTYLDLSAKPNIATLAALALRQILPAPVFRCASQGIPYATANYNDQGGWMGPTVPSIDFPLGSQLPARADHVSRPETCGVGPTQPPVSCSTLGALR